jgi:SAM-dependent methyltransferase
MADLLRRWMFNLWYTRRPPWDTGISPPELMAFLADWSAKRISPGRALDLGCGNGTNVITLAKHGWQVTGVDYARLAIQAARRKARQAGVQVDLQVGDVTDLRQISGPFDLALDMGCFHSLSPQGREKYIHNLERLLAPAGTYLVYVFFRLSGESGQKNLAGLLEEDLNAFKPSFTLVERQDGTERGQRPSAWLKFIHAGAKGHKDF